jgi:hypothetical protein
LQTLYRAIIINSVRHFSNCSYCDFRWMRSNDAVFDREFEAETNSFATSCIQALQSERGHAIRSQKSQADSWLVALAPSLQNRKRADHLLVTENFRPNPAAVGEKESNFNQEMFLQKGDGLDALEDEEPAERGN